MINIVCVLRSGGVYTPDHVENTRRMVAKNVSVPYRFVCFSDMEVPNKEPLLYGWPGWWSKIEIFRLKRGFYIDLDNVIIGNIDHLLQTYGFRSIKDKNGSDERNWNRINSSVMSWTGDYSYLIDIFRQNPDSHMREHSVAKSWGDQGFIGKHVPEIEFFDEKDIASKWNFPRGTRPTNERIVFFHGRPKPFENSDRYPWVTEYYDLPSG